MTSSRIERPMAERFGCWSIVDEHTRECLAIDVARKLTSEDVLERVWLGADADQLFARLFSL